MNYMTALYSIIIIGLVYYIFELKQKISRQKNTIERLQRGLGMYEAVLRDKPVTRRKEIKTSGAWLI